MFPPNYSTLKKYPVHYWLKNKWICICLVINYAGQKENISNPNGVSWWTRLPTGEGKEGEMKGQSSFRLEIGTFARDGQHAIGDQSDQRDLAKASSASLRLVLKTRVFSCYNGCFIWQFFLSLAFVLSCLKSDTVKRGSKNPGLIPTAELHQPKYNILTAVI